MHQMEILQDFYDVGEYQYEDGCWPYFKIEATFYTHNTSGV